MWPVHVAATSKSQGTLLRTAIAGKDKDEVKHLLPYLSAHTRQASESGEMVTLDTKNWKDFALAHKGTPFSRKVEKLLDLLASRSEPGRQDYFRDSACQFMVADFTGHRGGVYFEAGFAKGLGRPVIWTCREIDFENIHFDIAQFSHIIWKDPADLRTRLADRIKATIPGAA